LINKGKNRKYNKKVIILGAVFLLFPIICFPAIYQYHKNGVTVFTDQPKAGAKEVHLPPANRYSSSPTGQPNAAGAADNNETGTPAQNDIADALQPANDNDSSAQSTSSQSSGGSYGTFAITSPTDQQTFQNQRVIFVQFNINPALRPGDKVLVFVDNGILPFMETTQTQVALQNLPRGERSIFARLVDKNGGILMQTNPIKIYVKYATAK
jgi:hypothetical protein